MPATQSAAFSKAVEDSRKLKAKPKQNELLQLYALFKQGTQDPPFEQTPEPTVFDLTGKTKRRAWEELVEQGVSPQTSQEKYVALVEKLKGDYGYEG